MHSERGKVKIHLAPSRLPMSIHMCTCSCRDNLFATEQEPLLLAADGKVCEKVRLWNAVSSADFKTAELALTKNTVAGFGADA